jgi:hypothetical protein
MKLKSKLFLKDREGEERKVYKFLWWPRCLGTEYWRWLEYAFIIERIIPVDVGGSGVWGCYNYKWVEVGFDD